MSKATVLDPTTGPASAREECAPHAHSLSRHTGSPLNISKRRGTDVVEAAVASYRNSLSPEAIRWP